MLLKPEVMLDNLILSLSDSLDLIHPIAVNHQQRVAYISLRIAKKMGFSPVEQSHLMYAAVLHDIGVLSVEEKIGLMTLETDLENVERHSILGADLLRRHKLFEKASEIVRLHHRPWNDEDTRGNVSEDVRLFANIINLADFVDRYVKRGAGILNKAKSVCEEAARLEGKEFSPDIVSCLQDLSKEESFWLDFSSPRIYSIITRIIQWPRIEMDLDGLEQIGKVFSQIVDFRSHFTATHSAGVAAVAQELARRMLFSEKECRLMLIAGYLHDLGKVAVPNSILEKPDKLDPEEFEAIRAHTYHTYHILTTIGGLEMVAEWAAFHHERLDGNGYPFHLRGDALSLGSRVMCVADVFTALTENRPYREGLNREKTLSILHNMVANEWLDGNIVKTLEEDYEEIDKARSIAQEVHAYDYTTLLGKNSGASAR